MDDDTMLRFLTTPTAPASLETRLAARILAWLDSADAPEYYRAMIKDLRGMECYDIHETRSLRFNLWCRLEACLWPADEQVKSSNDITFQFAVIRVSQRLNEAAL